MKKISVVLPTYNRAKHLQLSLASLTQQTFPESDYEIIVVDDGSSDNTQDVVLQWCDRFSNIKYLFQPNEGYCVAKARNQGITAAQGEYLLFIDSGMIASSQLLEEHFFTHIKYPGGVGIGVIYMAPDQDIINQKLEMGRYKLSGQELAELTLYEDWRRPLFDLVEGNLGTLKAPWITFSTGNVSLSKQLLSNVGLFDEDFRSWGNEDTELGYRLYRAGALFCLNQNAIAIHCEHPKPDTVPDRELARSETRELFFKKHPHIIGELIAANGTWFTERVLRELNFLIGKTLIPDYLASEYSDFRELLAGLIGKKLCIGFGTEATAKNLDASACLEAVESIEQSPVHTIHGIDFYNLIGIHTPFPDQFFDYIIITDFWRWLSIDLVYRMLTESLRIGKTTLLVYSHNFDASIFNHSTAHCKHDLMMLLVGLRKYQLEKHPLTCCEVYRFKEW